MKIFRRYILPDFKPLFISIIFVLMAIPSCSRVKSLDPAELSELISSDNDNLLIFDLRSVNVFTDGHLKGAQNIPFNEDTFSERITSIGNNKKSAVFYCGRGIKTEKAIPIIEKSSFVKIYVLKGGFEAWRTKGLEIAH